ncbi:putative membrane protein [Pseudobutyrivibrio sp. YE44]|uniref:YhgE/Pip domain-containing protein n=1 Tax=Pseudobutyrivibrio sp. YE44 TaxID=1520802 RepID=UPI00087EE55D|nr:YhgE/Pip domain-containing protein [Pseudobutyrivibrio sp. YE44]SDB52797.1 putative membrane protein [Pseudobutyrivibrio sp. YE44]
MKNIRKIFVDDILSLAKNFFALVIVVGICFLPALYAWFNIYSNWDPYGNTGALKLAAVSLDKGYTDEDGNYHNQGDTIIDNLHENTAVNWQFVDSSDQAIEGVYSGEYYAAVVIDENFTYNMYNVLTDEVKRPTLHFYENQKKNPVATKISDTVVQTLQNNINVAFTEVVVSEVISGAEKVSDDIKEDNDINLAIDNLRDLSNDLSAQQETIKKIIENDAKLKQSLKVAENDASNVKNQARKTAEAVYNSKKTTDKADVTLNSYSADVDAMLNLINGSLSDMDTKLKAAEATQNVSEITTSLIGLAKDVGAMKAALDTLNPEAIAKEEAKQAISDYSSEITLVENILRDMGYGDYIDAGKKAYELKNKAEDIVQWKEEEIVNNASNDITEAAGKKEEDLRLKIAELRKHTDSLQTKYDNQLVPKIHNGLTSLSGNLNSTNSMLNSLGDTFGNLMIMFTAIDNTVDAANTSLTKTSDAIAYINGRLIEVIDQVDKVGDGDKIEAVVNALSGDPEVYGKFFSEPVEIKTEAVYPIENYGSAVAPFYSTLAFWVGALILTAIIKVHPDKTQYPDASKRQLFFGRYVLYWILGQLQAVVIVLGDLFLLHVQCIHPWFFMLAASVIATTFTLLIYSLVVTWGDVGKALSVVIVVIQIAGSSGTYPIELLPDFFKKMYIFFPFPYAINAIRECLCGMYHYDYLKYLACLGIFMVVALVIGLLIQIPFEPINHYMEERMEDTEMM